MEPEKMKKNSPHGVSTALQGQEWASPLEERTHAPRSDTEYRQRKISYRFRFCSPTIADSPKTRTPMHYIFYMYKLHRHIKMI